MFFLKGYTFQAAVWDFVKKWEVLGSNDNKTWNDIDNRTLEKQPSIDVNEYDV